jgi:hypothetical protein
MMKSADQSRLTWCEEMITALEAGDAEIIATAPTTISNRRRSYEDQDERQSRWNSIDLTEKRKTGAND